MQGLTNHECYLKNEYFIFWKTNFICIKKNYKWIRIISWKIKHKQNDSIKPLY